MKRKIIKLGSSTLVTSLPSKWIKKLNLKQGDELEVNENETNLILSARETKKENKEKSIDISGWNQKDVKLMLVHIYRKGFDKIKLINCTTSMTSYVRKIASEKLLGFEVSESGEGYCVIENLAEPSENKDDVIINRVFLIVKEMQKALYSDFSTGNYSLENMISLLNQSDKFVLFSKRNNMKQLNSDAIIKWELMSFLLNISHNYYYLYDYAAKNNIKFSKDSLRIMKALGEYFDLYHSAYLKKDMGLIHKMDKFASMYQFGDCLKQTEKNGKVSVAVGLAREILRWTQVGRSPIISLILEQ